MKTKKRFAWLATVFVFGLLILAAPAKDAFTVPGLAGKWTGESRFTGINFAEAHEKRILPQDVTIILEISTDGKVAGKIGDAKLDGTVTTAHRGWVSRLFGVKSNFIIQGSISGAIVAGSEGEIHPVKIPFAYDGKQITGTVFAIYPVKYPYPILGLRLNR